MLIRGNTVSLTLWNTSETLVTHPAYNFPFQSFFFFLQKFCVALNFASSEEANIFGNEVENRIQNMEARLKRRSTGTDLLA